MKKINILIVCLVLISLISFAGAISTSAATDSVIDYAEEELISVVSTSNVGGAELEGDVLMSKRLKTGGIIFVVSLIIALIVVLVMRSSMKTIKRQRGAASYIVPGSFRLNTERDVYLYTTTRVVRHESNKSSGADIGPSGRGGKF